MEHLVRPAVVTVIVAWACLLSTSVAIFADSPKDEPPRYCTVFTHFIKSGGSSVKLQLAQNSKREKTRPPGLISGLRRTTPDMRLNTLHNASVIVGSGEMLRGALEGIERECEYFTMMRHPIERLVSAFYYCPTDHQYAQSRPSKWCGASEGEEEPIGDRLVEFAQEVWGNKGFGLMMNSIVCDKNFELCDAEHATSRRFRPVNINSPDGALIHDGVKRILSTYTAVGIFEEWELSMRLFDAKVKSPVRRWGHDIISNAGYQSGERQDLLDWAHTNVDLHNALAADILLYEYALALFKHQTRAAL